MFYLTSKEYTPKNKNLNSTSLKNNVKSIKYKPNLNIITNPLSINTLEITAVHDLNAYRIKSLDIDLITPDKGLIIDDLLT